MKTGMKWDKKRIEAVRQALLTAGYKATPQLYPEPKGSIIAYSNELESCLLPAPDLAPTHYTDTPRRATECLESLIRYTGRPHLELGPLTKREAAYADQLKRLKATK